MTGAGAATVVVLHAATPFHHDITLRRKIPTAIPHVILGPNPVHRIMHTCGRARGSTAFSRAGAAGPLASLCTTAPWRSGSRSRLRTWLGHIAISAQSVTSILQAMST